MLLILAHHHDAEVQWLCQILKSDYGIPVICMMPEALGIDYSISLHLQNNGHHHSTIFFHEPTIRLQSNEVWYVINRLSFINPLVWQHADAVEKEYATNEINAFFPAFIHSFTCPVSNHIYNGSLYGEGGFARKWATCMQRQGISVHPLATDTSGKFFEKLNNTPRENICRFIYFNNKLISPPMQGPVKEYPSIECGIRTMGGSETLEFIFLKKGTQAELLQVSKTPSLSYYGTRFTDELFLRINETHYDTINGHTQRNTVKVAR